MKILIFSLSIISLLFFSFLSLDADDKKSFTDIFEPVNPQDIVGSAYTSIGHDWTILTVGSASSQNSMIVGFGGHDILAEKPSTWNFLKSDQYSLKLIREVGKYTMSYFPVQYKEDLLVFGSKRGQYTSRIKKSNLTPITTPSGLTSYAEASLILECSLLEVTTVRPDDFLSIEEATYIGENNKEMGEYNKLVFGEITAVWREN
jgi:flavin reductase (DIM6/NTAB) family NADH-FMN oxidoreductase RutF